MTSPLTDTPENLSNSMPRIYSSLRKRNAIYPIVVSAAVLGLISCIKSSRSFGTASLFSRTLSDFNNDFNTKRLGCLEHPKGGQTCMFGGISCIDMNTSNHLNNFVANEIPIVYFVSDYYQDFDNVSHDYWCNRRYRSADLNYWGPRVWPPPKTFAPRHSCLIAKWRKYSSIFKQGKTKPRVRWVSDLALFNLDFRDFDHNNHYLMDLVWFLDFRLWYARQQKLFDSFPKHFNPPKTWFFPQSHSEFELQTSKDINRLLFALILGKNLSDLYSGQKRNKDNTLETKSLNKAYDSLQNEVIFSRQGETRAQKDSSDLVCTKRLLVGHKIGNVGDERVCSYLREIPWKYFNTAPLGSFGASGYLWIDRPPKRVVLLDRHISRPFDNLISIIKRMNQVAKEYSFEFEVRNTSDIKSAEDHVKFFSRVGVLLTPHGSQSMGAIWMPRYSALIEALPPVYYDYSFRSLSQTCNVQFFELYGRIPQGKREKYKEECGPMFDSHYDQCAGMKNEPVFLDIEETVDTVLMALRKIGYKIEPSRFISMRSQSANRTKKFVFSEKQQKKTDKRNAALNAYLAKLKS